MSVNPNWNAGELEQIIRTWLADESNHENLVVQPAAEIESYLSWHGGSDGGDAASEFLWIYLWRLRRVLIDLLERKPDAPAGMNRAHLYNFWQFRIRSAIFLQGAGKKRRAAFRFSETGLLMAHALALGRLDEAATVGRILAAGIAEGMVSGEGASVLGSFMMQLYSRWRRQPLPQYRRDAADPGDYRRLLDTWSLQDEVAFTAAVKAACDFHTQLSGDLDSEQYYEYTNEAWRLYPVEILAVLRLRQALGLSMPEVSHPLLDSPLGVLYEPQSPPPDPLLERVIEKYRAELQTL